MMYFVSGLFCFLIGFLIGAHYVQWAFKPVHDIVKSIDVKYKRLLDILQEWQSKINS